MDYFISPCRLSHASGFNYRGKQIGRLASALFVTRKLERSVARPCRTSRGALPAARALHSALHTAHCAGPANGITINIFITYTRSHALQFRALLLYALRGQRTPFAETL